MYLRPAFHKLLSWTGQSVESFRDVSHKSWTIAPAETQIVPTAIYNPNDLERVTHAWNGPSIKQEVDMLAGGTREHAATIAYQLRNADVVDGHIYCERWKDKLLSQKARILRSPPQEHSASGTLSCTYSANHFFGHWLLDDTTLYLAAEEIGNPFIFDREPYFHEPEYRQLLDIPRKPIKEMHFDELIILQDFGQNTYKRKRYETLRTRVRDLAPIGEHRRIMMRRGTSGVSRAMVNQVEVENYLISIGFKIVDPEHLSPSEIVKSTMGAEMVIGVEGSQLLHAFLTMAEGGTVLCLQPPYRFNSSIRCFADCLGMHYAMLVGHQAPGGFRVDLEELKFLLERIDTMLGRDLTPN